MAHSSIRNEEQFQELMYRWLNHFDWAQLTTDYNLPSNFMYDAFDSFEKLGTLKVRGDDPRFPPLVGLHEEIARIRYLLYWRVWWHDAEETLGPALSHWPRHGFNSHLGHIYGILGQILTAKKQTPVDEVIHTEFII